MKLSSLRSGSILLAALFLSFLATPLLAGTAFSKIVVFGDSLNDSGNMVQFTGGVFPNAPTYVYGRQSNGRVWVEYLASRLRMSNRLSNYAVVGALTAVQPGFPTGNVWSDTYAGLDGTDVATQVLDYLTDSGGVADSRALHVLQGGSNDLPRVADPSVIVQNLTMSFLTLQQHGAKHIVLVSLPDLGKTPRVILGERTGQLPPGTAASLSSACAQLNQALRTTIGGLVAPDVTVTFANMDLFLDVVTARPRLFRFTEVQLPYLL